MDILCIYCLFQVQRDLIFISIIINTYVIFGFNIVIIGLNHVYFMYILSISGSKIFNFHFYYY